MYDIHLPIYYRILSGSIKDVSIIEESLANLKLLGSRSVHLVMDKGFFSEANINALYNSHYRYAVTKCTKWNGHRCYIHTYYDSLKAELDHKKFTHKLLQCYDELVNCKEKSENQAFYNNYFIVRDLPKRGRKVEYKEGEISKHTQY